jgi:DNA-3-methyladenine glycosylase II
LQLATKAAGTIFARVLAACSCSASGALRPAAVLGAPEGALRSAGLSGRKVEYMLDLARRFADGSLSDAHMAALPDAELRAAIVEVHGLGPWTADMHLIFALGHPDVLPVGDLGVRRGVQLTYDLKELPTPAKMEALTAGWRPWRSVGSWYMWRVAEAAAVAAKKKKPAAKK